MDYQTLRYQVEDGVAWIVLNRPDKLNAIDAVMDQELPQVWQQFAADEQARVAVITGAGERALCTGADLNNPPASSDEMQLTQIRWTPLQNRIRKPVICAVNGMAVGGGLHFVVDADIVIAADNAWFSDPHVAVGFVSGLEAVMLARRIPLTEVFRLVLLGGSERLSAEQAQRIGLVSEVVPQAQLRERAQALAAAIARHSPSALARTKQAVWDSLEMPLSAALQHAWQLVMEQRSEPDFSEGPAAFVERRAPQWRGR